MTISLEPDEPITDEEVMAHLRGLALDPAREPYHCALEVSDRYSLPIAEAHDIVGRLA